MCNGREYCRRERAFRASLHDAKPAGAAEAAAAAACRHDAKVEAARGEGAETVRAEVREAEAEREWRRLRPQERGAEAEIERTEKLMHLLLWGPN